jgi:uncharacterized protein
MAKPVPQSKAPSTQPASASCTLALKVIPGAPRDEVIGMLGDALKIKIRAPALEGRANEAIIEFLADALGLPRRGVSLLHGDKSRQKVIRIEGLSVEETRRLLKV